MKNMTKKTIKRAAALILSAAMLLTSIGCLGGRSYSEEYDPETDFQYSYGGRVLFWKRFQADENGQYILKKGFIYYHNNEKNTLAPLCNKPNCLHDMESDSKRIEECNAYAMDMYGGYEHIQYNDGYIYYLADDRKDGLVLRRIKKNGSQKDTIFNIGEGLDVNEWLIHRGAFYYSTTSYYSRYNTSEHYVETPGNKFVFSEIKISSNMKSDDATVIYEVDDENYVTLIFKMTAYKNYIAFILSTGRRYASELNEESNFSSIMPCIVYDTQTKKSQEIKVPINGGEKTRISTAAFFNDKIVLYLDNIYIYNISNSNAVSYPMYSMDYDFNEQKVWLDDVPIGQDVQFYGDYVIMCDFIEYEDDEDEENTDKDDTNEEVTAVSSQEERAIDIKIYSSDGELVSYFSYPLLLDSVFGKAGNFTGFGPDGINLEFKETANGWELYMLDINDVLNCHGEKVTAKFIGSRSYGPITAEYIF